MAILLENEEELFSYAEAALSRRGAVLAIDGRCCAGKTTFARALSARTGAAVAHADDFFIPKEKREPSPEVNLDGRRLLSEVLLPLSRCAGATYGVFDCTLQRVREERTLLPGAPVILEGSYLLYPAFRFAYTATLFLDISPEAQKTRVLARNPEKAQDFFTKWIPMEEAFFSRYALPDSAQARGFFPPPGQELKIP